jgi:adenylosuccinate lyase
MPRERAYEIVQRAAMRVWEGAGGLHDLLKADPDVAGVLSEEALASCFDAERTLRHVDAIYARAFESPA